MTDSTLDLFAPGAIDELFRRNRALYGDSTMEATGDGTGTPPEGTGTPPADAPQTFSADYVGQIRSEAAGHRTAKVAAERDRDAARAEVNTLREQLAAANGTATSATDRITAAETTVLKYRVALEKGLPAELVDRLVGSTAEELAADADVLLKYQVPAGTRTFDQGNTDNAPSTPTMSDAFRALARGN